MKTRIVKHTHSAFDLDSWKDATTTYYTVEYKTWFGWRPVYEWNPLLRITRRLECSDFAAASKLKKFVDETGRVMVASRIK